MADGATLAKHESLVANVAILAPSASAAVSMAGMSDWIGKLAQRRVRHLREAVLADGEKPAIRPA